MKLILLVATFILLADRIKNTPSQLSYKIWRAKMQQLLDKNSKTYKKLEENGTKSTAIGCTVVISWIFYILLIIYYLLIGYRFSATPLFILSAIQIITVLTNWKYEVSKYDVLFNNDINSHEFRRWWKLFNVILDYIYYLMAIWMLLK